MEAVEYDVDIILSWWVKPLVRLSSLGERLGVPVSMPALGRLLAHGIEVKLCKRES
jgi:hypothetical protein